MLRLHVHCLSCLYPSSPPPPFQHLQIRLCKNRRIVVAVITNPFHVAPHHNILPAAVHACIRRAQVKVGLRLEQRYSQR
jgi:hypothetical protein